MGRQEGLRQGRGRIQRQKIQRRISSGRRGPGQRPLHQQPLLPARHPQLQAPAELAGIAGRQIASGAQLLEALLRQLSSLPLQLRQGLRRQRQPRRALQQQPLLRLADAVGREHTSQGMEQHPPDCQRLRQPAGVLAAGTAVAHQQGTAQVVAALDRDAADGAGHRLDGDRQGAGRHLLRRDARRHRRHRRRQLREALLHRRPVGRLIAIGAEHGGQRLLRQPAEQQVGVGDRGRPAAAIGRRPRRRARRFRAHPQPLAIEAHDRAAAGRHRVNRQHRRLQAQAGDLGFRLPLPGQGPEGRIEVEHIGGGAAHVEAHHRLGRQAGGGQGPLGHRHRPHHAAGGAREDRVLGLQQRRRRQGAAGAHHPQPRPGPQIAAHLIEIGLQHRRHRRLHQGGMAAGHQPRLAAEAMGEGHRAEAETLEPGAELLLVGRLHTAVQQRHRAAAVAVGAGLAQLRSQGVIAPQRLQLLAIGRQPPLHLEHPHRQGLGALDRQREDVGAVLIADLQQIGEAAVDQQQHRRAVVLEQGIGGHGGAEPHLLHQPRGNRRAGGQAQQAGDGGHRRITGALGLLREHLAHPQLTLGIGGHHIGEGAAAIDPEPPALARWRRCAGLKGRWLLPVLLKVLLHHQIRRGRCSVGVGPERGSAAAQGCRAASFSTSCSWLGVSCSCSRSWARKCSASATGWGWGCSRCTGTPAACSRCSTGGVS